MAKKQWTAEKEAEAKALAQRIQAKIAEKVLQIARDLKAREDRELFGTGEVELRKQVLQLGADILQLELDDRAGHKKGVSRS